MYRRSRWIFSKVFTLLIPCWTKYPKQHISKIVSSTSNFDHGIYWLLHTSLFDDPETRYKKLKKTASQFLISQFGKLCIVALCFPSVSWLLHSINVPINFSIYFIVQGWRLLFSQKRILTGKLFQVLFLLFSNILYGIIYIITVKQI